MAERETRRDRSRRQAPAHPAVPESAMVDAESTHPVLALQRAAGNQAVQRQLRAGALAPWLVLGQRQTLGNRAVQRLLQRAPTKPAPVEGRPSPSPPLPKMRLTFDSDTHWLLTLDGVLVAKVAFKSRRMPPKVRVARADGHVTLTLMMNRRGTAAFEPVPLPRTALPYSLKFRKARLEESNPDDDDPVLEE